MLKPESIVWVLLFWIVIYVLAVAAHASEHEERRPDYYFKGVSCKIMSPEECTPVSLQVPTGILQDCLRMIERSDIGLRDIRYRLVEATCTLEKPLG